MAEFPCFHAADPASAPLHTDLFSDPMAAPQTTRLRTYLVEDNATIRDNLIATLDELVGITPVGHAAREQPGSEWLREHASDWDLAIVDLFLTQGSGFGVLAACQQRKPWQKVVVLSNYATPDVRPQR